MVTPADNSRQRLASESGQLVADALASALFDLAEALHSDAVAAEGPPAAASATAPPARAPGEGGRSLASLTSRAVSDAAGAIAAAVVPAVVEHIDVNALLAEVDVNALLAEVDVNALLAEVDVNELVGQIDVAAVAREALEGIDIGDIIQESTAGLAIDTMEAVRVQAMNADDLLARIVDRLLGRRGPRDLSLDPRRAQ
ncbi:MAG: hypothetical protein ACAH79_06700 [Thermoleophilia bacterium]